MTTNLHASDAARGDLANRQDAESLPSGVLDLEALLNRCMGNIDLVQRVLKMFQERIPEEMEAMEKALELNDAEQLARLAHRVKGSSASVSADALAKAAAEIEDLGRAGRLTDLPASIEHFHGEWQKYLDHAMTLLSAGDAAPQERRNGRP